jgi:threonine dehydrogenase-like Zn-dependent dehydrogenase
MTRRYWVVTGQGRVALQECALDPPGAGRLLLQTEASLVSAGTELAIFTGIHQGLTNPEVSWPRYPQEMGYMAVARVVAVGANVPESTIGQRLLTSTGHASHATVPYSAGPDAPYWQLPDDAPATRLVWARMAKTAFTALTRVGATAAQSGAVLGLGVIGQIALRLLYAAGAWPIAGIDRFARRRAAALRGGATTVSASADEAVGSLPSGGADIVLDCTGAAIAVPTAMRLAADAGTVVVLGSPRGRAPEVDFYSDLHRRSLVVAGAHDSGIGAHPRERYPWTSSRVAPAVVDWVYSGRLPVDDLVTHLVAPERLPEMYAGLLEQQDEFLGVVLDWSRKG